MLTPVLLFAFPDRERFVQPQLLSSPNTDDVPEWRTLPQPSSEQELREHLLGAPVTPWTLLRPGPTSVAAEEEAGHYVPPSQWHCFGEEGLTQTTGGRKEGPARAGPASGSSLQDWLRAGIAADSKACEAPGQHSKSPHRALQPLWAHVASCCDGWLLKSPSPRWLEWNFGNVISRMLSARLKTQVGSGSLLPELLHPSAKQHH